MTTSTIARRDDAVVGTFRGQSGAATVAAFDAALQRAVVGSGSRFVIVDFTGLIDFSGDMREQTLSLLRNLRARGVVLAVGVSSESVLRLTCSGLALAAGLPMPFVDTLALAHEVVDKQRSFPAQWQ